jgi:hypothetical protein
MLRERVSGVRAPFKTPNFLQYTSDTNKQHKEM